MRNNEQRVLFLGFEALLSPIRLFATSCRVLVFSIVNIRLHGREITNQMFESAVLSLPIILFSLTIVSLMSILEFSWHMKLVLKQDALVPGFSMVLMVREVAPVVTAMLLTSRVGASIAAELGFMKVTEQLDQLKLLSVSEVEYLVIPRWVGCVFASITLTLASLVTSICVSTGIASRFMNYQPHEFFNTLFVFTK
ncbi:MAG: ABC transporter permease, partial [Proteobacteria bacterium]|nr:ABC transporter permease [Pseudomonadota bacterium]